MRGWQPERMFRLEGRSERIEELEAALRDTLAWLLLPSDVYPHQVEELGRVRAAAEVALQAGESRDA